AARDAARDAEEQWQFDRLVAWLSEDEPQPLDLPEIQQAAAKCEAELDAATAELMDAPDEPAFETPAPTEWR
ncbi:MAG: hypothetical protein AAFQ22_13215, partial [Pseudomonadota bacterium]